MNCRYYVYTSVRTCCAVMMYVVLMVNACIIAGTLINELNLTYLAYFTPQWNCVVILHTNDVSRINFNVSDG